MFLGQLAAAAPPTRTAAPVKWHTTVKLVRIGEESTVDAATLRFVETSNRKWENTITPADLPAAYRSKTFSNDSFVVVEALATGKPAGCRPLRPSAEPALDALACRLLVDRANFRPRYAGPGRPIGARWVMAVRWETIDVANLPYVYHPVVPTDPPGPGMNDHGGWPRLGWHDQFLFENVPGAQAAYRAPASGLKTGRVNLDLIVDPEAGIIGCEIGVGSGSAALDEAACALARGIRLRYRQPCDDCFRDKVPVQVVWNRKESRVRLPLASPLACQSQIRRSRPMSPIGGGFRRMSRAPTSTASGTCP